MIFVGCDSFLQMLTISWVFSNRESTKVYRCKFVIDIANVDETPDGIGLTALVQDF